MANGANDRVFDEMRFRTGAAGPPLFNPEETYYQPAGSNELYKKGDRRLGRHEIVDEVTMKIASEKLSDGGRQAGSIETGRNRAVPSPVSRGLIPLIPTSPLDLALETLFTGIGEAGGAGAEIGAVLGLGAGIRGGKYAIDLGDKLIKGGKYVDDTAGHAVSKYRFRRAFDEMGKDPMFEHIDFRKASKFERPGTPYTTVSGGEYGAKYTPKEGMFLFEELFPKGSKGWYAKPDPKTGYIPSMKTDWQGGKKYMGETSGREKPFTFRTQPFSKQLRSGYPESYVRHEGRHFMQDYPMTPTVEHSVWDDLVGGKPVFNVSKMYGSGSFGGSINEFKTLIDIKVPKFIKEINSIDRIVKEKKPRTTLRSDSPMGKDTGYRHGTWDSQTGEKISDEITWMSGRGPIEVEARLEEIYSMGGVTGAKDEWRQLRQLGYENKEIMNMLKDYTKKRHEIYGQKPGGFWSVEKMKFKKK